MECYVRKSTTYAVSISLMLEIFFLLGFIYVTYKYNLYILYGISLFIFLLYGPSNKSTFCIIFSFLSLSLVYGIVHDLESSIRVIKTMVVFVPFFFTARLEKRRYGLSKLFDCFMKLNALLVCLDFFLFFAVGQTLFRAEVSGFMPRPCGLLEDSNFFSYLMLVYIFYVKWSRGKYSKLCVLSLFLSGSFSAIITFLLMSLISKMKVFYNSQSIKPRLVIVLFTFLVMLCYDLVALYSDNILDYIYNFHGNDLLRVKMYSMSHRFDVISNAFGMYDHYAFGLGAGKTRSLSEIGLNLHNSLLQVILEMGFVLFSIIFLIIIMMMRKIKSNRYLLLFCAILILSSVMETIYNPLLSFVYFLSFSDHEQITQI